MVECILVKTLLVLGAGLDQIPGILKAKEMGCYIICLDGKQNAEAKKYCDEFHVVSIKHIDQLENFVASYPKSEKREEAAFFAAECFYKLSPEYSLDQTDTNKALDKMQRFIDIYPESQFLPQANVYVKELREKLEKKAFEIAKQYNTISDFKGALKAFENFLADYPGTPFKEQALFYRFDSAYKLAINSVVSKKQERLTYAKNTYSNLIKHNAQTEYKDKADKMLAEVEQELQKYTKLKVNHGFKENKCSCKYYYLQQK